MAMLRGTRLYSVLYNKCPKCHTGDFFVDNNPYHLKHFAQMHDHCSHCGELFNKEVGFFYGAMYVSYGLNIALGVGLFILLVLLFKFELLAYLFTFFGVVVILFPWIMRISRLIYINMFVKFDSSKK